MSGRISSAFTQSRSSAQDRKGQDAQGKGKGSRLSEDTSVVTPPTKSGGRARTKQQPTQHAAEPAALPTAAAQALSSAASNAAGAEAEAEADEAYLRGFDLDFAFGPLIGTSRLDRWERAQKLGLEPPADVKKLILRHGGEDSPFNLHVFNETGAA